MNQTRVLIVEDDATLRRALCDTMEFGGYEVADAINGIDALAKLNKNSFDMVISDVQMDEMDGTELLQNVRRNHPSLPFVLMTAYGSVPAAVQAMRDGATDYLQKPFEAQVLLDMVSRMETLTTANDSDDMIAVDSKSKAMVELAERVAKTEATVLISGESGTGKEVLARKLHQLSDRNEGPFVALNCAAIPETMLEAMLFGYERGAYTGAQQARPGKFEQANGGTLLLDEISEMDLDLQAKLLRVLQEREVERLGGSKTIPLDVRVIATTNRKLVDEVAAGRFREDLYYRLNVFPMVLAPLRDRPADILPLAEAFLMRHSAGRPLVFTADAHTKIKQHAWYGNVRELDNCIQRAAIMANGNEVRAADIMFDERYATESDTVTTLGESEATTSEVSAQALGGDLKEREKQLILDALRDAGGNRKLTSERLGISPRTLRYKLAKFREEGIELPGERSVKGAA